MSNPGRAKNVDLPTNGELATEPAETLVSDEPQDEPFSMDAQIESLRRQEVQALQALENAKAQYHMTRGALEMAIATKKRLEEEADKSEA